MANNQKPQKAKNGFKQKIANVGGWVKSNLRMIGAVVLVLGMGFVLGWWARSMDVNELQTSLNNMTAEKDGIQSELDNYTVSTGDCYDPIYGVGGPCPTINVLEAKRINDPELPDGFYFVSAEVEFENKNDSATTVGASSLKLKDDKSYVYSTATSYDWQGQKEITYDSIASVGTLTDQGDVGMSTGEKVRGTVIFKVTRDADSFTINYATAKSQPFSL